MDGSINPIDRDPMSSIISVMTNLGVLSNGSKGAVLELDLVRVCWLSTLGNVKNAMMKTRKRSPPIRKNGSWKPLEKRVKVTS